MNDKRIAEAIAKETERQLYNIELIASENYVSADVLAAAGNIFHFIYIHTTAVITFMWVTFCIFIR